MSPLIPIEVLGWVAAALTLATFVCRDMLRLRLLALAANLAFIGYGLGVGLWPVATLHLLLVPVNLRRLMELRQAMSDGVACATVLRQVPAAVSGTALGVALSRSLSTTASAAAAVDPMCARADSIKRAARARKGSRAMRCADGCRPPAPG